MTTYLNYPEYLEPLADIKLDVNILANEFRLIHHLSIAVKRPDGNSILQRYTPLVTDNKEVADALVNVPYTAKVVNEIRSRYEFDTVRYISLMPFHCYGWHTDYGEVCLNIPVITNKGSRFIYEDRVFQMPADGTVYVVNNGRLHSFANSDSTIRTHLIFENLHQKTKINK